MGFIYQIFQRESDLFSFYEELLEMHEIEEDKHSHPDIILAVSLEFLERFQVVLFRISLIQRLSFRS